MSNLPHQFKPLKAPQAIPVQWVFSQDDYTKLAGGYHSNWHVFMDKDVVHICRIGGEEFYRFALTKTDKGKYLAESLETYEPSDFYKSAKLHGWTDDTTTQHKADFRRDAVEETAGLLSAYFGIHVHGKQE